MCSYTIHVSFSSRAEMFDLVIDLEKSNSCTCPSILGLYILPSMGIVSS